MRAVWLILAALLTYALAFNAITYALRSYWLRRAKRVTCEPLSQPHATYAFLEEWWWIAAAIASIPFAWALPRRREGGAKGAVVLVHGWGLNRACFFLLERRLRRDGWGPILLFDYWPFTADVSAAADQLTRFLNQHAPPDEPVTLIGHSLGGLVVREFSQRRPESIAIRRLVTLGTPHYGTRLATLAPRLHALAPGSDLLQQINQGEHDEAVDVIAISSTFDALIVPPGNAIFPNAFNIQLNDIGHNGLLYSGRVYELIRENLDATT